MFILLWILMLTFLVAMVGQVQEKRHRRKWLAFWKNPPPEPKRYPNMKNCTINNIWIDEKGWPHKLSLRKRLGNFIHYRLVLPRLRRFMAAMSVLLAIPGIPFTAKAVPADSNDTYAITEDTYEQGGFRVVADAAARLAIPADRRKAGMLVRQLDTDVIYQLKGGITDGHWALAYWNEGYIQGGYRSVADAAARLAIPADSRKEGMLVKQLDTGVTWTLTGGILDANWAISYTNDSYIQGGFRQVANAAARLAIPAGARKLGMLVKQLDNGIVYTLDGGLLDVNWIATPFGSTNASISLASTTARQPWRWDVQCPGTRDETYINAAVGSSRKVLLSEGIFYIDMHIGIVNHPYVTIDGQGDSTILFLVNHTHSTTNAAHAIGDTLIALDDVSKFTVGMIISFHDSNWLEAFYVNAIDPIAKTITLNVGLSKNFENGTRVWPSGPLIYAEGSPHLTIQNLKLDGNSANQIGYNGTYNYAITYPPPHDPYYEDDAGIILWSGCHQSKIRNCSIENINGHSIFCWDVSACQVLDNYIYNSGDKGICYNSITPGLPSEGRIIIRGNTIHATGEKQNKTPAFATYGDAIQFHTTMPNSIVADNIIYDTRRDGIRLSGQVVTCTGNSVAYACRVSQGSRGGISSTVSANNITGNEIWYTRYANGIDVDGSNVVVSGNWVWGAAGCGIFVRGAGHYSSYTGNVISQSGEHGIYIYGADNNFNGNFIDSSGQSVTNNYANIYVIAYRTNLVGNQCRAGPYANKPAYGVQIANGYPDTKMRGNDITGGGMTADLLDGGVGTGPRKSEYVQCFYAKGTIDVLAATANGAVSATAQPDAISGRNTTVTLTKGTGDGSGKINITGTRSGKPTSDTKTWTAGAGGTIVLTKVFDSIDVNGILIENLTGTDKISVGLGNKIGLDHPIFTGAVKKVYKSGVGNYTNYTVDIVEMAIQVGDDIAANDTFQVTSLDCLA